MSALCVALAVAAAQSAPAEQPKCANAPAWRAVITETDGQRLRDTRRAWTDGLAEAGAAARDDPLFDPDQALERPLPPAGSYRCRFVKLGGAPKLATREWGRCEVGTDSLVKLDGPQRPTGRLYADGEGRGVFLGTLVLGDETRPTRYGRDRRRDLVGVVERVGEARWRVALPRPGFESTLDLIELVPA